jgi:hypothetical protein
MYVDLYIFPAPACNSLAGGRENQRPVLIGLVGDRTERKVHRDI